MSREQYFNLGLKFILPILIFFLFFSVFGFIYLASIGHMPTDDVFFHASAAVSYLNGETPVYPIYTTFATKPADIWYGYHRISALIIKVLDGSDSKNVLNSLRLMNSLFAALYFALFYLIVESLSRSVGEFSRKHAIIAGIIATISLYTLCPHFDFRILIIRPHLFSSLFFLLSVFFLVRNKFWALFLIAGIMPFVYSFSLLILIPSILYLFCTLLYNQFKPVWFKSYLPLLVTFSGLFTGIVLRPDSLNYVYNGFLGPLLALGARFGNMAGVASELNSPTLTFPDLIWLLPFTLSIAICIARYVSFGSFRESMSFNHFYLAVVSCTLFVLFMLVERASEYFFPFFVIFSLLIIGRAFIVPLLPGIPARIKGPDLILDTYLVGPVRRILEWFSQNKKICRIVGVISLAIFFCAVTLTLVLWQNSQPVEDRYKGASEFISRDSGGEGIIFTQFFHMFPPLVFYNSRNSYIMGFDPIFTYNYDRDLYYLWYHAIQGEKICSNKVCSPEVETMSLYDTLKTKFSAGYIFVDHSTKLGNMVLDNTPKFSAGLESDSRFKKVYTDEKYPEISVYRLE